MPAEPARYVGGNVVRSAWRQRYVPSELMGRVVTTSQVVNFGTMPLAGLLAGWLGAQVGVGLGVVVSSCVGVPPVAAAPRQR